jgi:sulfatase maturation enzyme AslB (radical SAM superfamily)
VNNSGKDLKIKLNNNDQEEWKSSEQIIESLIKISKIRNIKFIKFFGGEPLLRQNIIKDIIKKNECVS